MSETRSLPEVVRSVPKPRLLDLFCGAGGAAVGYARAGLEVIGVDILDQPAYPFPIWLGDALDALDQLCKGNAIPAKWKGAKSDWYELADFDAIHASPPCQAHTSMSNRWRGNGGRADSHENLIPETRELLEATGLPYVIENVGGARAWLRDPVVLNGAACGLPRLDRPRLFETNWPLMVPPRVRARDAVGVYGKAADGRKLFDRADGSTQHAARSVQEGGEAMGIDWMTWDELREAIPPAMTELVGEQLLSVTATLRRGPLNGSAAAGSRNATYRSEE